MRLFKTTLLATITLFTLTGCCWTDHSETIKEVAEPMLQELKVFYEKNKRFPSIQERNKILEKLGCKVDGELCKYKKIDLEINTWHTSYDYAIRLDFENTGCLFGIQDDGNNNRVSCGNSACIELGQ